MYASHNCLFMIFFFHAIYCNLHDMAGVFIHIYYPKGCYPVMTMGIYSEVMKHKKHNNSIFKSDTEKLENGPVLIKYDNA